MYNVVKLQQTNIVTQHFYITILRIITNNYTNLK